MWLYLGENDLYITCHLIDAVIMEYFTLFMFHCLPVWSVCLLRSRRPVQVSCSPPSSPCTPCISPGPPWPMNLVRTSAACVNHCCKHWFRWNEQKQSESIRYDQGTGRWFCLWCSFERNSLFLRHKTLTYTFRLICFCSKSMSYMFNSSIECKVFPHKALLLI